MFNISRISFLVLVLTISVIHFAHAEQNMRVEQDSKTKLESFQRQTGAVVIKGYSTIGNVTGLGSVSIISMEFTDATTGKKQLGVVIEVKESDRLQTSDRSFIDYDEIDPLIKGINYISKTTSNVTKLGSFEAIYKTKGDFSAIVFSSSGKIEGAVKSGNIRPATAYLSLEELDNLRDLVIQAKQKLDSLK